MVAQTSNDFMTIPKVLQAPLKFEVIGTQHKLIDIPSDGNYDHIMQQQRNAGQCVVLHIYCADHEADRVMGA